MCIWWGILLMFAILGNDLFMCFVNYKDNKNLKGCQAFFFVDSGNCMRFKYARCIVPTLGRCINFFITSLKLSHLPYLLRGVHQQ